MAPMSDLSSVFIPPEVDYTRNRADGPATIRHRNLWVVSHDGGRWGVTQRS